MPLPKPSKTISKRVRKPKLMSPFVTPPPPVSTPSSKHPLSGHTLCPDIACRTWRVRVVCTDPDATDDSSADERDSSPSSRKRFVHEVSLPVPPSSPPHPSLPNGTMRARRRRQNPSCKPILSVQSRSSCGDNEGEEGLCNGSLETCHGVCRAGPPDDRSLTGVPSSECEPEEDEFARFLSEFIANTGGTRMWEDEIDRPPGIRSEDEIADMLNLELDSEALTWINSLQILP